MTDIKEGANAEGGSRPHLWPCRHCDMVTDYHLVRESQRQQAEGVFRQDEDYRATTFKQWLQAFEWDSQRERHERDTADRAAHEHGASADAGAEVGSEDDADRATDQADPWAVHWSARWAGVTDHGAAAVPAPRTSDHDRTEASADDWLVEEVDRAEQLQRWHADDFPTNTDVPTNTEAGDGSSAPSVESVR